MFRARYRRGIELKLRIAMVEVRRPGVPPPGVEAVLSPGVEEDPHEEVRIGRYVVENKLGEGGMAETWLCRLEGARGFTKRVVIKTIKPACMTPEYESMFIDEARIGARLEHPNIPRVTEFGQTPTGLPFLVQEYVDGPSVTHLVRAQARIGDFNLRMACRIGSDIAGALDFAFRLADERGKPLLVIHRDVSPSNVLISRRGPAKLIDFGVATFADRQTETQTGILKGKLRFMAPEVMMRGETTHQGDIYSLGMVLYRMCVGRMPNLPETGSADGQFEPPAAVRADIDPELNAIIMRCIHPHRAHRFATGGELKQALDRWIMVHGGPVNDNEIAGRIAMLFPGGPAEWRQSEMTMSSLRSATWATREISRSRRQRTVVAALLTTFVLLLVASGLTGVAALWLLSGTDRAAVITPGLPSSQLQHNEVERHLDAAFVALVEGRITDAEAQLEASRAIEVEDPQLEGRRAKLGQEIKIHVRIRDIRAVAEAQPTRALGQALELRDIHPANQDVSALVRDLRELQPKTAPAPVPPRVSKPVVPAPTPNAAPPAGEVGDEDILMQRVGRKPQGVGN